MPKVIKQKEWSERELTRLGFARYERKKQLVMVRPLRESESPMTFHWPNETFSVEAGYMICYAAGDSPRTALNDYDHWPVRPDMFDLTYRAWDDHNWTPTPPEQHLLSFGSKPYYKVAPVWAKQLTSPQYVQSVESVAPVLVGSGFWVLIGPMGEPWYQDDDNFRSRYIVDSTELAE
jgi:hypothetical protein